MHKLTRTLLTLEKRTSTLRTLVRQGASEHRLVNAAERVRNARIHVLRAKIGEIPSVLVMERHEPLIAKLTSQIEALRATSPVEILTEFRPMASDTGDDP